MRAATLAFLCSVAASASPVVVLDGDIRGVPDGSYAPVVDLFDTTGAVVSTTSLADVAVVDGLFELELDLADVADQLAAGAEVSVDVQLEGLSAVARVGAVFAVSSAAHADAALVAANAESLGSIGPDELVQRDRVGTAGAVSIAFANLVNVPAGVADGVDNGNITTLGAGLQITGGTLRVTSVTTGQLIDGTVATAALVDRSFNSASLAGLTAVDVADGTLTSLDLGTGFGATDIAGSTATIFAQNIACDDIEGGITTSSSCTRRLCAAGAGRVTCGTSSCQNPSSGSPTCNNTALGKLLFAP